MNDFGWFKELKKLDSIIDNGINYSQSNGLILKSYNTLYAFGLFEEVNKKQCLSNRF